MDHKMRLQNLMNWIAMENPSAEAVAAETAKIVGLILHHKAEDEAEREHAVDTLIDTLKAAAETGNDR